MKPAYYYKDFMEDLCTKKKGMTGSSLPSDRNARLTYAVRYFHTSQTAFKLLANSREAHLRIHLFFLDTDL